MDEKEAQARASEKADKMTELTRQFAESSASHFEEWLSKHQDVTMQEKHDRLVSTFVSNVMLNMLMLHTL